MGLTNQNDISVRVGFDTDKLSSELSKCNSLLAKWGTGIQTELFKAFSIQRGLGLLKDGIVSSISTMANFQKSMSEVRAITGATGKEFEALRNNAINLAGAFKSIDISKLETELGRLGFSTQEILDSTQAIINLASATGSDLGTAATIAGSTLRAFNLEAKEMARVTDVMAGALNRSGLDMSNFAEAIKYVAPNAHAANISLEETSAMLGILADNGIKGSMAGTALRRIITDLSTEAKPLSERLAELGRQGLSASDAMDEIGRIGATALLVLSNNAQKVKELGIELHNTTGEAKYMSTVMQDNLIGDWNKLGAAWDTSLHKSDGLLSFMRQLTTEMTSMLNIANSDKISGFEKFMYLMAAGFTPSMLDEQINGGNSTGGPTIGPSPNKGGLFAPFFGKPTDLGHKALPKSKALTAPTATGGVFGVSGTGDDWDNVGARLAYAAESSSVQVVKSTGRMKTAWEEMGASLKQQGRMMRMVAVNIGTDISNGLAGAISGTVSFAEAMRQMALSVIDSLERMTLAWIIEKSVENSFNPIAALGLAVVGFGLAKALFGSIGGSSSGGGVATSPAIQAPQRMADGQMTGTFRLEGNNGALLAVIRNAQYQEGRTG